MKIIRTHNCFNTITKIIALNLPESISKDLLLVTLLVWRLCSSLVWSLSFACSHDSIFCRHSFGLVSSSGADRIGLFSVSGEGDEGRSRSDEKSAASKAGRFLGPLPLAFLAQERSKNNFYSSVKVRFSKFNYLLTIKTKFTVNCQFVISNCKFAANYCIVKKLLT